MKKTCVLLFVVAIIVLFAGGKAQASLLFEALLTGTNEVPPVGTSATGLVTVLLNDDEDTLTINLLFSGLSGTQTAAHIHGLAGPGVNAPVRIAPPSLPLGNLFDFTITIPTTLPGLPSLSRTAFVQGMKDGLTYFNIHSTLFPGGEIRGQLQPVSVPEPGTLLLLNTGLAGICVARRRYRSL